MLAPICLFTYNRLTETQLTVSALQQNFLASESRLIIFSDGGRNESSWDKVNEVRAYLTTIIGFKYIEIIESPLNKGLANSIISGVTKVLEAYGKVIVLEDDLITSRNFLDYMNRCLDYYEVYNKVISISGYSYLEKIPNDYSYDVAFGLRASSWGWATWKNRWEKVDWEVSYYTKYKYNIFKRFQFNRGGSDLSHMLDKQMSGKINSWAIRFCHHQFVNNLVDVYPIVSKIENIGYGAEAENCHFKILKDELDVMEKRDFKLTNSIILNKLLLREFRKSFSYKIRAKRKLKEFQTKLNQIKRI